MRKGFSKSVSNLIPGPYWEDLDKPVSYVVAKVMVTYVDVLGTRTKLWKPNKFQCTGVVLKNLAVHVGLVFGGRCEEKQEEDVRVCQLENFW